MFPIVPQKLAKRNNLLTIDNTDNNKIKLENLITNNINNTAVIDDNEVKIKTEFSENSDIVLHSSIGMVRSLCDIPSGVSSSNISLQHILKEYESTDCIVKKESEILISYYDGLLSLNPSKGDYNGCIENKWSKILKYIKLADDCHSYNVISQISTDDKCIKLSTTQTIPKGKPLLMWFTPEILAAICVPFLTPINIQGEKSYKCHKCGKIFEFPNPLKIHISLECKNVSMENIWKKLYKNLLIKCKINLSSASSSSCSKNIVNNVKNIKDFDFCTKTFKENEELQSKKSSESSFSSQLSETVTISDPSSDIISKFKTEGQEKSGPSSVGRHQSAFRPYHMNDKQLMPTDHINIHNKVLNPYIPTLSLFSDNLHSFISPQDKLILGPSVNFMQGSIEQRNLIAQQAVDMEAFVSNLGKSKQGHLCIYCGKIYSRKYGLKIHIRTHTGFKPLKCKYCFRPFGDPSNLNKHVRLHAEGETPYKCELCSKILVRRRDLERHMKSRHHIGCNTTNKDDSEEKGNHQNTKISATYTR